MYQVSSSKKLVLTAVILVRLLFNNLLIEYKEVFGKKHDRILFIVNNCIQRYVYRECTLGRFSGKSFLGEGCVT